MNIDDLIPPVEPEEKLVAIHCWLQDNRDAQGHETDNPDATDVVLIRASDLPKLEQAGLWLVPVPPEVHKTGMADSEILSADLYITELTGSLEELGVEWKHYDEDTALLRQMRRSHLN